MKPHEKRRPTPPGHRPQVRRPTGPTLTAKGDDALAEAILKLARENEVPIYENPELVKLLARMELGTAFRKSCTARLPRSLRLPGR